jgi:hypothetical protein
MEANLQDKFMYEENITKEVEIKEAEAKTREKYRQISSLPPASFTHFF